MGWNTINMSKQNELFEGVAEGSYVYFVHSLYPDPADQVNSSHRTEYGTTFTSAVASKNIYGTQFHPEKSGDIGLKILKNFAKDNCKVIKMQLFQQLTLMGGKIVRLTQGEAETAKCYEQPVRNAHSKRRSGGSMKAQANCT